MGNPAYAKGIEDSIMKTSNLISLLAQLQDGSCRAATGDEIISAAREHISRRVRRGATLNSPRATRDFLSLKLGMLDHEVFAVIFLDLCRAICNVSSAVFSPRFTTQG